MYINVSMCLSFQDNFYARLKIDGIQFIGSSFQVRVTTDVIFDHNNVQECGRYMNKTSYRPKICNKYVPVPCIYIGTEAGAKLIVFGLAQEGIQSILTSTEGFTKGSVYQVFYDNFILS